MKKMYSKPSVDLELTGSNISASLNAINKAGIPFLRVNKKDEITCLVRIRKTYLNELYSLSEKKGDSLRILRISPIYRAISIAKQRLILVSVLSILIFFTVMIPCRVLFIKVSGNSRISSNEIITAAESCGLVLGMSRSDIRSEKIKNQLLADLPQLQWVGVNTKGCVALINVRERLEFEDVCKPEIISDIVASADGFILGGTVSKGTACFYEGQSVQKGQVLISAYSDCGRYLKAVRAEGEIYAETSRNISAITPAVYHYRAGNQRLRKKYSIIIGKKRINLWKDSGISDMTCGRIYKEYHVRFPGRFDVPISLCIETFVDSDIQQKKDLQQTGNAKLELYLEQYLLTQMIAGKIIHRDYEVQTSSDASMIYGSYICHEMIGREKTIKFGDLNGKNS